MMDLPVHKRKHKEAKDENKDNRPSLVSGLSRALSNVHFANRRPPTTLTIPASPHLKSNSIPSSPSPPTDFDQDSLSIDTEPESPISDVSDSPPLSPSLSIPSDYGSTDTIDIPPMSTAQVESEMLSISITHLRQYQHAAKRAEQLMYSLEQKAEARREEMGRVDDEYVRLHGRSIDARARASYLRRDVRCLERKYECLDEMLPEGHAMKRGSEKAAGVMSMLGLVQERE